ncbi:triose-phosphate isomerase [Candidatus Saccharibacteria bacterium CPR2]|nr:triose-phosphate isomerase [Candidatus Saccharibacteria bacterium CPR2]
MRKKIIAGNWKMNLNVSQGSVLVHRLQERIKTTKNVEVILCPSFVSLQPLSLQIDRRKFKLGAQNAYFEDEGAFTGEVSIAMLRDLASYIIVGHSERRHKFGENDDLIAKKVAACVRNDIAPILCVGETASERAAKETKQTVHDQLSVGVRDLTSQNIKHLVVAYEPVWAIGSGRLPKPHEVEEVTSLIRSTIAHIYGQNVAEKIRILYGGSVNPDITKGYLEIEGIDGFLVGGASLNYEYFSRIVATAQELEGE